MSHDPNSTKRIVVAPSSTGALFGGEALSVEVGPNEDVVWVWSHDRERGSTVTGYTIVPRAQEHGTRPYCEVAYPDSGQSL